VDALAAIDTWPVASVGVAVVDAPGLVATRGAVSRRFRFASVTKLLTAYTLLVAVEEGTLGLDDPAGPEGSTVRHLLSHASGLGPDSRTPLAKPETSRIYSNAGFEMLGEHLARAAGMPFAQYLREGVLEPLGMVTASLDGSPAHGASGTVDDLARFARELLAPTLVHEDTLHEATAVQFPGLGGVLPGYGRHDPNDWGLGFELKDGKSPHWTGTRNSPATFGHFGRAGTFLWVDPAAALACVVLTDREFANWAIDAWPALSDAVLSSR
jgi:CubicO group peptidase (beta-lactamase class C family)